MRNGGGYPEDSKMLIKLELRSDVTSDKSGSMRNEIGLPNINLVDDCII